MRRGKDLRVLLRFNTNIYLAHAESHLADCGRMALLILAGLSHMSEVVWGMIDWGWTWWAASLILTGLPQVFVHGLILAGLGWCIQCLGPAVYPRISHVDGRGVNLTVQVHVKPLFVFCVPSYYWPNKSHGQAQYKGVEVLYIPSKEMRWMEWRLLKSNPICYRWSCPSLGHHGGGAGGVGERVWTLCSNLQLRTKVWASSKGDMNGMNINIEPQRG